MNTPTKQAQHTPVPWHINEHSETSINGAGILVASCGGYSNNARDPMELHNELKANAAFIVRACNSHDDLLAFVKAVEAALDGKRNRFGKLESYTCRDPELLRVLAVKYDVGGSTDFIEQAVKVARAIVAKVAA